MSLLRPTINRRALLIGGASCAAAASLARTASGAAETVREFNLAAAPGRLGIVGGSHPATDVWCYDNRVPGPEIRVRQGEPVRIVVTNQLPEETTVHWH